MQKAAKAVYVKPTVQRVSLMSNALSGMALACCSKSTMSTYSSGTHHLA